MVLLSLMKPGATPRRQMEPPIGASLGWDAQTQYWARFDAQVRTPLVRPPSVYVFANKHSVLGSRSTERVQEPCIVYVFSKVAENSIRGTLSITSLVHPIPVSLSHCRWLTLTLGSLVAHELNALQEHLMTVERVDSEYVRGSLCMSEHECKRLPEMTQNMRVDLCEWVNMSVRVCVRVGA